MRVPINSYNKKQWENIHVGDIILYPPHGNKYYEVLEINSTWATLHEVEDPRIKRGEMISNIVAISSSVLVIGTFIGFLFWLF